MRWDHVVRSQGIHYKVLLSIEVKKDVHRKELSNDVIVTYSMFKRIFVVSESCHRSFVVERKDYYFRH